MFNRIELFVISIIEGENRSKFWRNFFSILSLLFKKFVQARNFVYEKKWIKSYRSKIPVISVGNITAGGTGKTLLIELLCKELGRDKNMAVMSRGYRSQVKGRIIDLKEDPRLANPKICGDEPYLIAKAFPHIRYVVGRDRVKAIKSLEKKNIECVLIDDGFQYRKLGKNFEIVVLSAQQRNEAFLPRGYLRDDPKRLNEADLIVVSDSDSEKAFEEIKRSLPSEIPTVGAQKIMTKIYDKSKTYDAGSFKGRKMGAFCAIGQPRRFVGDLKERLGMQLVAEKFLPDHRAPSKKWLRSFAKTCKEKEAEGLICTEKDWVKLEELEDLSLPLYYVKAEMRIIYNKEVFVKCLETFKAMGR